DRILGATKLDLHQALPEVAAYVDIPKQSNAVYWDIRNGDPRQAYREAIDPVLAIASLLPTVKGLVQPIKPKAQAALAASMFGVRDANVFPTIAASSTPIAIVENGAGFYSTPAPAPFVQAPFARQIVEATPTGPTFAEVINIAEFEHDPAII